jgi:hypothetical protein
VARCATVSAPGVSDCQHPRIVANVASCFLPISHVCHSIWPQSYLLTDVRRGNRNTLRDQLEGSATSVSMEPQFETITSSRGGKPCSRTSYSHRVSESGTTLEQTQCSMHTRLEKISHSPGCCRCTTCGWAAVPRVQQIHCGATL